MSACTGTDDSLRPLRINGLWTGARHAEIRLGYEGYVVTQGQGIETMEVRAGIEPAYADLQSVTARKVEE